MSRKGRWDGEGREGGGRGGGGGCWYIKRVKTEWPCLGLADNVFMVLVSIFKSKINNHFSVLRFHSAVVRTSTTL